LKAAVGGMEGRPLRKGDSLSPKESSIYFAALLQDERNIRTLPWRVDASNAYRYLNEIYVIKGNEWDQLTRPSQLSLLDDNFTIHPSSDRMGYLLKGAPVELVQHIDLISSAVSFGTLQLLPSGQLVILMADHQTAGGYPRIAHVLSAHLPKLAQLRTSDCMQFRLTNIEHAESLIFKQQKEMQILVRACRDHLNALVC
jgi:antagonist of KipI